MEREVEALFSRLIPDLGRHQTGATNDQIALIERLTARPLPPFYRWFLEKMGTAMGKLAYPTMDLSASRVIQCYQEELVEPNARFLLIGYETNPVSPLHLFYDLDRPARDDALVLLRDAMGGELHLQAETFRELLVWAKFLRFRLNKLPYRCEGCFVDDSGQVARQLNPVLERLGFNQPIATGQFCGLFDRADAALAWQGTPEDEPQEFHCFDFGATQEGTLRKVLGTIATESQLEVEIDSWVPAR